MSQPRYSLIAETLSRRIAQRQYPQGELIPTEKELMDEFGVSRHTMRAALARLETAGLIARRRGHGTVVLNGDAADGGFHLPLASLEDLVHLAKVSPRSLHSLREVVVDVDLAKVLGIDPGTRWLKVSSTRKAANGLPMVWTEVYVAKAHEGVRKAIRANPDRLISELVEEESGCRIDSVEQDISATVLPAAVAEALQAQDIGAGLHIVRRYRDTDRRIVAASLSYHPAGRYTFSTVLVRRPGVARA